MKVSGAGTERSRGWGGKDHDGSRDECRNLSDFVGIDVDFVGFGRIS